MYYPEAIELIEEDQNPDFETIVELTNIDHSLENVIKYLRGKYYIIHNSGIIRIVSQPKTSTVHRYKIYFFKQIGSNYHVYRAVVDYSTDLPQEKVNVVSFILYINNNEITGANAPKDTSLTEDTDMAYGYKLIDIQTISDNQNVKEVISFINNRYADAVVGMNVRKVEELILADGRINYKIIYNSKDSEFKFIIFYQPTLKKVLVLNSVNLPQHSHYNQMSGNQQKQDSLLKEVLAYLGTLHPEQMPFNVKTITKAVSSDQSTEYNIVIEFNSKKYKSYMMVASNNVDMKEISFSEQVEISLDHYRLDQYDEMFIMNYQKMT